MDRREVLPLQEIHHLAKGDRGAELLFFDFHDGIPAGHERQTVIVRLRSNALQPVIGDGNRRYLDRPLRQGKDPARKDQLEDQDKRHHRHGSCGGAGDAGDPQRKHIRGISDQEHRDADINDQPRGEQGFPVRELHPGHLADVKRDDGLQQAKPCLIDHMSENIRADVQAGTMLAFNDVPFPAHDLDRVEAAVPDRHTGQGKSAFDRSFHCQEEISANDHGNQTGDERSHRHHFPVILINKTPQ